MVAWGALISGQRETGWLQLEISSNPAFPDQTQARAAGVLDFFQLWLASNSAGILEGYLTRNSINEYYKEFFANGLCLENPDFCDYMREQIDVNDLWVKKMVEARRDTEPFWHMVNMFYSQVGHQAK